MSTVYTGRVEELGPKPSTRTVGDSFDNAMAQTVNRLYKTKLLRQQNPCKTVEEIELATLEYVWWWNHKPLHSELDMRTPVEIEQAYYAAIESLPALTS